MTDQLLYLSQADVASVGLTMAEIINALEEMFHEKGEGRVEMPPKPGIHTRPDAFIHAMPAYIPALESAGMKWVSGYPENQKRGLPYITGLLILNDAETGIPLSVMDCVWITAMRTGAATAVAAKYLARFRGRRYPRLRCAGTEQPGGARRVLSAQAGARLRRGCRGPAPLRAGDERAVWAGGDAGAGAEAGGGGVRPRSHGGADLAHAARHHQARLVRERGVCFTRGF